MTNGLLVYDYIFAHFLTYSIKKLVLTHDFATAHSKFPDIGGKFDFLFISVPWAFQFTAH